MTTQLQQAYNTFPYESFAFAQTHPTHLFTLARLFGLNPTPIEKARVLELGCASGGNLIPMAYHFPTAEILGIDLSDRQIEDGVKQIIDLGLNNIKLRHQSITDFSPSEGKFDYIICHGVYSWVDDQTRDKILSICRNNLTDNGIAYVSYNTLPGWNMANSVRDLMLWHTKNIPDPVTRVQQARAILQFITKGLENDHSPYANFLRSEIQLLSKQSDSYIFHEHLEPFNKPLYFHQFMEQAAKHDLNYLSDTFLATMYRDNLVPTFATELNKINDSIIVNQYMDFIRNQRFRCTLMCHASQKINRAINTKDIESFYLQLIAVKNQKDFTEKDVGTGKELTFTIGSVSYNAKSQFAQLAMLILHEKRYQFIHYTTLCDLLSERSGEKNLDRIKHALNDEINLMRLLFGGLIQINSYSGKYINEKSAKPLVCPLARYQAKRQRFVTNRLHQPVMLDALTQVLIPMLDGTNDLQALTKQIQELVDQGKLLVRDEKNQQVTEAQEITRRIPLIVQHSLDTFARQALYVSGTTQRDVARVSDEMVGSH